MVHAHLFKFGHPFGAQISISQNHANHRGTMIGRK
jgi:hypothetical protein